MWVSTEAIRVIVRSPAKNLNFTQRLSLSFDALHLQLSAHCSRQSWFPCRWSPLHEHLDRSARSAHPAWPERRSPASDQGKFNRLSALPQGQAAELRQVLDSFYDGQEVMLQNRTYLGDIVHKGQFHPGEHTPIIDQPLWDAVQEQLAGNTARRQCGRRTRQSSLLAGMLFDGDGNRMTPSHAGKKSTHYRYYVSGSLITKDRTETSAGLRIPAVEIEQLVSGRVHRWLLDPGSIFKSTW